MVYSKKKPGLSLTYNKPKGKYDWDAYCLYAISALLCCSVLALTFVFVTGLAGRALQILSTCTVLGAVFGCGLGLNDYFVLRKELRKELEYADDEMGGTSRKRDAEDDDFIPGHKERKAKRKRKQQAPLMLIPLLSFVGGFIGLILGLLILFLTYVCYGST